MACKSRWGLCAALVLAACGGNALEDEGPVPGAGAGARRAMAQDSAAAVAERPLDREVFRYSGGNRDPFESLLNQANVGPELADLNLVAVYLDHQNAARNVAVFRERVTGRRYTMHEGDRLGRLQVVSIRERNVSFLVDDFGVERRETVALRKSQEENTP